MNTRRTILAIVTALLVLAPAVYAQSTPSKMYRWVGPDGKTHYSDDLPPELVSQARQELSKNSGMTLKDVDRALTPEERAAAQVKADADAKAAEAIDKAKQNDQILLSSYPTEADLTHAYSDRAAVVAENLKSTRLDLDNQEQSMSALLIAASDLELAQKPINMTLAASIRSTRGHILEGQQTETELEAQTTSLHQEAAATLTHYRQIRAAAAASVQSH